MFRQGVPQLQRLERVKKVFGTKLDPTSASSRRSALPEGCPTALQGQLGLLLVIQSGLRAQLGVHSALQTGLQAPLGLDLDVQLGFSTAKLLSKGSAKWLQALTFMPPTAKFHVLFVLVLSSAANLDALGANLRPTWTLLGPSWTHLGPTWTLLGPT